MTEFEFIEAQHLIAAVTIDKGNRIARLHSLSFLKLKFSLGDFGGGEIALHADSFELISVKTAGFLPYEENGIVLNEKNYLCTWHPLLTQNRGLKNEKQQNFM